MSRYSTNLRWSVYVSYVQGGERGDGSVIGALFGTNF